MKLKVLVALLLISHVIYCQEETLIQKTSNGSLEGTLLIPAQQKKMAVVLLVSGSGPTDRNGNNEGMQNNSLKLIAEELALNNIASFRFDKRGIGQSSDVDKDESKMHPETFVQDIKGWIDVLHADKRFDKIILAGHSEGALLGMLASIDNPKIKGYVSIAGAGRPIDAILKEQFSGVSPDVKKIIYDMIDQLKRGDTIARVPVILYSVFRPSIQPYMTAWMKYDPAIEIKKLLVPILITTGTRDIQVKVIDAELLAKAQPKAKLKIIKNMNHVLKDCDTLNKEMQMPIYGDPNLPLNKEFSETLLNFMSKNFIVEKKPTMPTKK
jgi:pimeloyl-ACP methyl ester carboxylesterase